MLKVKCTDLSNESRADMYGVARRRLAICFSQRSESICCCDSHLCSYNQHPAASFA